MSQSEKSASTAKVTRTVRKKATKSEGTAAPRRSPSSTGGPSTGNKAASEVAAADAAQPPPVHVDDDHQDPQTPPLAEKALPTTVPDPPPQSQPASVLAPKKQAAHKAKQLNTDAKTADGSCPWFYMLVAATAVVCALAIAFQAPPGAATTQMPSGNRCVMTAEARAALATAKGDNKEATHALLAADFTGASRSSGAVPVRRLIVSEVRDFGELVRKTHAALNKGPCLIQVTHKDAATVASLHDTIKGKGAGCSCAGMMVTIDDIDRWPEATAGSLKAFTEGGELQGTRLVPDRAMLLVRWPVDAPTGQAPGTTRGLQHIPDRVIHMLRWMKY